MLKWQGPVPRSSSRLVPEGNDFTLPTACRWNLSKFATGFDVMFFFVFYIQMLHTLLKINASSTINRVPLPTWATVNNWIAMSDTKKQWQVRVFVLASPADVQTWKLFIFFTFGSWKEDVERCRRPSHPSGGSVLMLILNVSCWYKQLNVFVIWETDVSFESFLSWATKVPCLFSCCYFIYIGNSSTVH